MRTLGKNIKGFTIFELLIVMAIIGIMSGVAYPNFSKWNKERKVRQDVEKISSLIKNIYVQTEKGTFAYVQVKFTNGADSLRVETKGMTMSTLADKINNGSDIWNTDTSSRCDVLSNVYWDTDIAGSDQDISKLVYNMTFDEVTSNLASGTGMGDTGTSATVGAASSSAICFSRGGKFYEANGELVGPEDAPFGFIYLCRRISSGHSCPVSYGTDTKAKQNPSGRFENLSTLEWSRYGNFSRMKWDSRNNRWFEG